MGWFGELGQSLTALLVPESCASCGGSLKRADDGRPCTSCRTRFKSLATPWCDVCMEPLDQSSYMSHDGRCRRCSRGRAFGSVRAYGPFDGLLKELVSRLKYSGEQALARPLGHLVLEAGRTHYSLAEYEAVIPVPLHRDRLAERGFNQAYLLARPLADAAKIPIVQALQRPIPTASQVSLEGDARASNVREAFSLHPKHRSSIKSRAVLLVDDVLTTGATAEACANTLLSGGADRVDILVLARTP